MNQRRRPASRADIARSVEARPPWLVPVVAVVALVAVAGVVALAVSLGGDDALAAPPPRPAEADSIDGSAVYDLHCSHCHGGSGEGRVGPRLANSVSQRFPDIGEQVSFVRTGNPPMPPFSNLTAAELWAVVEYTRTDLGQD